MEHTPVAIVGAGPIGLELAAALRQAAVEYVQLEAGAIGSTIAWWAPGTHFFSSPERIEIAGVPLVTQDQTKATREQYLAYLRTVVLAHDLDVRVHTRVERIERGGERFRLHTTRGGLTADRVVLAIGNMHAPRLIDVPGEHLPHVDHYFREPHHYFGSRVVIVGGKNSAVEAALRLYRCGVRVDISYRGDRFDEKRVKYWLRPEIEWLIDKGRIGWHPRTVPVSIDADQVVLGPAGGGEGTRTLPADFVLLLTGYVQDGTLFDQLALERRGEGRAPVVDRDTMAGSVEGVSVAGTAIAGTQRRTRVFIENAHVHVSRIVRALTGEAPGWVDEREYSALEEA